MKKLVIAILASLFVLTSEAQVTWNVRAGGGVINDHHDESVFSAQFSVQANFPLGTSSRWFFSPTPGLSTDFGDEYQIELPLYIGYKASIGRKSLFFPKIGIVAGLQTDDSDFIIGPAFDLAFELNHFVVAVSGYYSITERNCRNYVSLPYTYSYYNYYTNSYSSYTSYTYFTDHVQGAMYNFALTIGYKF